MALQRTRLATIQYLPNSGGAANAVLVKNASTAQKVIVKGFILFNASGANASAALFNVPSVSGVQGTPAGANQFFYRVLASNETYILTLPYPITMIDTNEAIFGVSDTNNVVTCQVLGDRDI